jgi:cholesterol oxidase
VKRWLWLPSAGCRGIFKMTFLPHVTALSGVGVGGGSLVYANIHVRPDDTAFDDPRWPRAITRSALDAYFDRVAATLRLSPPPSTLRLPKRDAFRRAAQALGRPVFDPDMAVDWNACRLGADCEFGCPHGAKQSLDVTYIAGAEALGASVRPRAFATHVQPDGDGYRVHFIDGQTGARDSAAGRRVVLAAGTLGTNEILLRSWSDAATLPRLSAALGTGISANGDFIGSIQNASTDLEPWVGPDVTSVMRYTDSATPFTVAAPSFNRATMTVLASFGQPRLGLLRPIGAAVWPLLGALLPMAFARGAVSQPQRRRARHAGDPSRMTNVFAIGRDNANGRAGWRKGRLDIAWHYAAENRALVSQMTEAMRNIAAAYGGTFAPLFTWDLCRRTLTVHPLGGCAMSDSPERGVVSPEGEVFGYPGLYIADGSVVPTSLGFHPCMTIAGIAERTAEAIVSSWPA